MFKEFLDKIFNAKQDILLIPYKIQSKRTITDYLNSSAGSVRINIGSGPNLLSGWLNGDLIPVKGAIYINAIKRLPFRDNCASFINAEHLVEHLGHEECQDFFRESHRILCPGGVLRVSTPDMEKLIQVYLGNIRLSKEELLLYYINPNNIQDVNICLWLNNQMRLWGHKFIFDEPTLTEMLKSSGFYSVEKTEYGRSSHPELQGIERHNMYKGKIGKELIMILEARK